MRKRILGSLTALLAGAGLAWAQPPARQMPSAWSSSSSQVVPAGSSILPVGSTETVVVSDATTHSGAGTYGVLGIDPAMAGHGSSSPHATSGSCADGHCGDGMADCSSSVCGQPCIWWFEADYLYWWMSRGGIPPLITTGPPGSRGIIGQPGTQVLLGGQDFGPQDRNGFRLRGGAWFTQYQEFGFELTLFSLGSVGSTVNVLSRGAPGEPILANPFFDVTNGFALGTNSSLPVAQTGLSAGSINVNTDSRLFGGEANFLANLWCYPEYRIDLILGFRHLDMKDGVGISDDSTALPGLPRIGGSNFITYDQFSTTNRYYGLNLGLRANFRYDRWNAVLIGKCALGDSHEIVNISGSSQFSGPGFRRMFFPSGLYAQRTNIGRFSRDQFGAVPEIDLNVGYQITGWLRGYVGYSWLYWDRVVRAGDQINPAINPTQVPLIGNGNMIGPGQPAFSFRDTSFMAHGLNFGLELRF